jgi:hypothetical protein
MFGVVMFDASLHS